MTDTSPTPLNADTWQAIWDEAAGCRILQRGRHCDGTFVRLYVPKQAEDASQTPRVILYLHGFALCLPDFYDAHMRELASQGWIVIFPDFQRSTYKEAALADSNRAKGAGSTRRLRLNWWKANRWLLLRGREKALLSEDLPEEIRFVSPEGATGPTIQLPELRVKDLRRVLLPWILIQLVLFVIGWFRRTYARNLGELLGTVLLSLAYAPRDWLRNALTLAEGAWMDLSALPPYQHWRTSTPHVYGFGHSLGGLLALSLPWLQETAPASPLQPLKILACDPATSTEMGIPSFVIALLKVFNAPFTSAPLDIRNTGPALRNTPVAILHGRDDTIVPPQLWAVQGGTGAFASVGSAAKALLFASSNRELDPQLVAFHNQAVTSTQTFDDALFDSFGGVKHAPNPYNTAWIWPVLSALFAGDVPPPDLLARVPKPTQFAVSDEPPPPRRRSLLWLLVVAALLVAGLVALR